MGRRRCHSAREDLLLTLLLCINKPILDESISALGVGAEPHRQAPGLCLSVCPLCSCSNASGDSISLATVGFAAAAATPSPMVPGPLYYFLSIGETRRFCPDCCHLERAIVPMRLNQIKRSRRVGVGGWRSAWQEARWKRARPCALATSPSDFRRMLRLCRTLGIDHTTPTHSSYIKHRHCLGKRVLRSSKPCSVFATQPYSLRVGLVSAVTGFTNHQVQTFKSYTKKCLRTPETKDLAGGRMVPEMRPEIESSVGVAV